MGFASNVNIIALNIQDIIDVNTNSTNVNIVAADITSVNTAAGDILAIVSVANDKVTIDSIYADKATLDRLYASIDNLDRVFTSIDNLDTVKASIGNVDTVATDIVKVNNYYDTYLGEGSSDPAARRDGSALLGGELFFNTTLNEMRVYENGWLSITYGYSQADLQKSIGNINNPLLDLPLNNSLAMKQGVGSVTFSRSTTATYVDRYGVLQYAAIDEPRFEKDGLLIEGVSTNLVLNSEVVDGVVACTITSDAIAAPNGNVTADKVTGDGTSAEHYAQKIVTIPDDSTTYTLSVFVKKGTADTIKFALYIIGGSTIVYNYTTFTFSAETATKGAKVEKLSDGWYRLSQQITNNSLGNTALYNRIFVDGGGITTSTDTLYVWGMQSEALPFASSYIPTTTAAVTRGAENCYTDLLNNTPYLIGNYSVACDFNYLGKNTNNTVWSISNSTYIMFRATWGNGNGAVWYGTAASNTLTDFLSNTEYRAVTVYTASDVSFYVDGVYKNKVAGNLVIYNGLNRIQIGSERDPAANNLFGHIKNFRIWDRALTTQEAALC